MKREADKLKSRISRSLIPVATLLLAVLLATGCVYYNTFYNARKAFNTAEKQREKSGARSRSAGSSGYKKAIEKALKVVENHPNSKYYDDAVYVLGVSYYHTGQFSKAERRFREILANYPESQFYKESKLYLAKAKLRQDEMDVARALFEEVFQEDFDRDFKTDAAMALGTYFFDAREWEESIRYFRAIRDSLGNNEQKKVSQEYIANAYFESFRFNDALSAYLQILGMDPTASEKYHAIYQAAMCSYRLQRIDDGIDYLETLVEDQMYYDSLGILRLGLAEGYEYDDDLLQAELMYDLVASQAPKKQHIAQANYFLGLTYQFDYDDLLQAKKYYDKAAEADRGSDFGRDALQRSSDIGKLETFARTLEIDSTTTQDMIDEAAETQYRLAELYWFSLQKPDTAMLEMQYVVDSFPTAHIVPRALVALSEMHREQLTDSAGADSLLRRVLVEYPRSDYLPEALGRLGLLGTEADSGYAGRYLSRAEDALVFEDSLEIARQNYQYIVDSFPESDYYLQARFALIWITETYDSPGDSSLIFAYSAFADSFEGTYWAIEANKKTDYNPPALDDEQESDGDQEDEIWADTGPEENENQPEVESASGASSYADARLAMYIHPNGDTLVLVNAKPIETLEEFEFPTEAYGDVTEDFYLYFQILLDFSGKVVDYVLKIRSENEEINTRVTRTIESMTFDPLDISNQVVEYNLRPDETGGYWFVYKYFVNVPDYLK